MKNAFLFSDTVPPILLKEAFQAAGFRLVGVFLFYRPQKPRFHLKHMLADLYKWFLFVSQRALLRRTDFSHCSLFFYTSSEADEDFFKAVENMKATYKLTKVPAHISDLSKTYAFKKKRFFSVGAPGSGNMIFLKLSDEILKLQGSRRKKSVNDPIGDFLTKQALLYMSFVRSRIRKALKPCLTSDAIGPEGFGRCFFAGDVFRTTIPKTKSRELYFFTSALPFHHQAWANPLHTSHESLSTEDLRLFQNSNTSVIQIIRHPLDNLLSITSKIAFHLTPPTSPHLREDWVHNLLNTEPWFLSLFESICKYYEEVCKNKLLLNFIRYEGLFHSPADTVKVLASYFERSISKRFAFQLCHSWANRKLAGSGHRWQPGLDKWKRYLPQKFQNHLDRSNLKDICHALGYEYPGFNQLAPIKGKAVPRTGNERLALEEIRYYFLIGKQPYFKNPNIKLYEDSGSGIRIGGLRGHVDAVRKIIDHEGLF